MVISSARVIWLISWATRCETGACEVTHGHEAASADVSEAALTADIEDEPAMARHLLRLTDPDERARWSEKSLRNAQRFSADKMIGEYIALYRALGHYLGVAGLWPRSAG
jgi:glycosyltransferase involved in cell wall biosynthesis